MIVQMKVGFRESDSEVRAVVDLAERIGLSPQIETTQGEKFVVTQIKLLDGDKVKSRTIGRHVFRQLPGVETVTRVTPSLVSLTSGNGYANPHVVKVGKQLIGNDLPCKLIAGPCTVDSRIDEIVAELKTQGVTMIRGGCWKPRSKPGSFTGFGKDAVRWLVQAAIKHRVPAILTEVMDETQMRDVEKIVDELGYKGTVVLWVGARTENQNLLIKLGRQTRFPVMLKNPINGSFDAWINRAEFVLAGETHYDNTGRIVDEKSTAQGNDQILLCNRGIEGDDRVYRFNPNHHWIDVARRECWAPVGVDPSHSAGTMVNDLVLHNLEAALHYKPAFAMVEVYLDECTGLCDAQQAVPLSRFGEVKKMITSSNTRRRREKGVA